MIYFLEIRLLFFEFETATFLCAPGKKPSFMPVLTDEHEVNRVLLDFFVLNLYDKTEEVFMFESVSNLGKYLIFHLIFQSNK